MSSKRRKKIVRIAWIIVSVIMILSMVVWSVGLAFMPS